MKTEQAIQVLRDYNLWRRGNEEMEQPDPWRIGEAIDDVLMAIDDIKEEAKLHRGAITGWQNKWECAVELASKAQADLDEEVAAHAKTINDLQEKEDEVLEQARLIGMGAEREAKLIAERDRWRAEAQRWEAKVIDLGVQIDLEIQRLQWKQNKLEFGIKELKDDY